MDEEKGTLRAWKRELIGALILKPQPQARPEADVLHPAMLRWIRAKGLSVLGRTLNNYVCVCTVQRSGCCRR